MCDEFFVTDVTKNREKHCTKYQMQLPKFFDPILWLQACQCLCTRRKFAHKQFPFPLIQSITQSTQFHPSLNTKIYTFDLLPFHSRLQIHISLWILGWSYQESSGFQCNFVCRHRPLGMFKQIQFYLNISVCLFS